MGQKNKTVLALLIAVVIVAAVGASSLFNLISPGAPAVVLPAATEPGSTEEPGTPGGDFFTPVEVTPETVQSVIETLSRPSNYARTVTILTAVGGDAYAADTARVWVDGAPDTTWPRWTQTERTRPTGQVEHSIIEETGEGEGTLYLWYNNDREYRSYPADRWSADLSQRIPTYEDVLALERDSITDTGYEEKSGTPCIYVEVEDPELHYRQRYWVSVSDGLLVAAETVKDGQVVLSASASGMESTEGTAFTLPDGTLLHRTSD